MRAKSIFAVPASLPDADRQQRRHALVRLSLAWLAMMQVMMFAWPGYLRHESMPADALETLDWAIVLMNWASFALTVPVVLYSAWPIWRHAGANLRQGRAGMDVPVALGIVAAFIPSVHATYTGRGEVYFDSVTMFVAFLLTARYLELCARQSFGGVSQHRFARERHELLWDIRAKPAAGTRRHQDCCDPHRLPLPSSRVSVNGGRAFLASPRVTVHSG